VIAEAQGRGKKGAKREACKRAIIFFDKEYKTELESLIMRNVNGIKGMSMPKQV